MNIALSLGSMVESTSCQTFSFCIQTATGSCIAKIVSVFLPPLNHKGGVERLEPYEGKLSRTVVCPAKAGVFGGS